MRHIIVQGIKYNFLFNYSHIKQMDLVKMECKRQTIIMICIYLPRHIYTKLNKMFFANKVSTPQWYKPTGDEHF